MVRDSFKSENINVTWQTGFIPDVGRNGAVIEDVINVCILRIDELNKRIRSIENEAAIINLQAAMNWLTVRTKDRLRRNVEGTANQ